MTDADDTANLTDQLAAHRRTLAVYLRQLASLGADHAPPGVHNGIADTRAAIARLKAALRAAGAVVEEQAGEVAAPLDLAAQPLSASAVSALLPPQRNQPLSAISDSVAQALLDQLPLDHVPDVAALPPGSRMPLRPNPLFVGREADLLTLAAALKATLTVDSVGTAPRGRPPAAVISTGIGGVGKTQLAVEIAHRYGQFFVGGVFWLSFADPAGVDDEIAACGGAGALELYSDADGLTQAEQVARVYAAWQQPIPRLLIIDNCDDLPRVSGAGGRVPGALTSSPNTRHPIPDTQGMGYTAEQQLAARLPSSGGCRVLVTSRRGQWHASLGLAPRRLGVLDRTQSVALLQSHRNDLSDADASAIADMLGDLPLALTLAGNYLETYRDEAFGAPATYLTNLWKQLLDHRSLQGVGAGPSFTNHELNVRATVDLSYARLDASDPTDALAIAALARAAQLMLGEPFPRELLLVALGDANDEEVATRRADALGRLVVLGLLDIAEAGVLRIHRLIAIFARSAIADDTAMAALAAMEQALSARAYAITMAGYPAAMQPILAHLRHATERAQVRDDLQAATLCSNLGAYLRMIGDYATARPLLERALAIREQVLGSQHPVTAMSLNNLARLLHHQGDTAAARPLYERALATREQVLGSQHPDTATSLNNLAALLARQGDTAAARSLIERALAIDERALGPQHPDTATSLNNLAELLRRQGDIIAARPLYERALVIREQALGPQHPATATSLNNLAALLVHQGDTETARPLLERALAIREQALGPQHPDTAQSRWWLGTLLKRAGDLAGAHAQLQRAVAIYTRALGEQHLTTRECQRQLAEITAQDEVAIPQALAALDAPAPFAVLLEADASWAEQGEAASSPYLDLAALLHAQAAQLIAPPAQPAEPDA